jgi:hypothetical protein
LFEEKRTYLVREEESLRCQRRGGGLTFSAKKRAYLVREEERKTELIFPLKKRAHLFREDVDLPFP